jgi:K+-transporting ATPase ATPase B chain
MATSSIWNPALIRPAIGDALKKLNPRTMMKNPVMFVVEIGSLLTSIAFIRDRSLFSGQITLWLWFTVIFANFAEAMAEGRGKAQAENLKKSRMETQAFLKGDDGKVRSVPSSQLKKGDKVVVAAGQVVPADGTVIEGVASVDESAITGESAPVR